MRTAIKPSCSILNPNQNPKPTKQPHQPYRKSKKEIELEKRKKKSTCAGACMCRSKEELDEFLFPILQTIQSNFVFNHQFFAFCPTLLNLQIYQRLETQSKKRCCPPCFWRQTLLKVEVYNTIKRRNKVVSQSCLCVLGYIESKEKTMQYDDTSSQNRKIATS